MTTIARVVAEIDRRDRAEIAQLKIALDQTNSDYADLRMDLEELARENDELKTELGRSEDRRYEP